jgi:pilus assembly protein Flp/PilA
MVRTYAAATALARSNVERLRDERGQTAVEYLGVIALAVSIAIVISQTNIGQTIADEIKEQVERFGA